MKKQTLILIFFLLAGTVAQAALPQGRWTVEKVTVEKNTGGSIETNVYNSAAELQGFFIPCMQELVVNEQTVTLRYPNDREETWTYSLEGDTLTIHNLMGAQTFQYSINGENLILTAVYSYVNNNLQARTSTRIIEKRIINFNLEP